MLHVDTIIRARWVVPMAGSKPVLSDHAVVINHGKIKDVLPIADLPLKYTASQTHYLDEHHVVLPGLINAHTHTPMSLMRGLADDLPLMQWLKKHTWPAEQANLCPEFIRDGMRLGIAEMLKSGTTCFNDMFYFASEMADMAHEMKIRAVVGNTLLKFEMPWMQDAEAGLTQSDALLKRIKEYPLVSANIAPHSPYAATVEIINEANRFANRNNIRLNIHLHEPASEITEYLEKHQQRPLALLARRGLCSSNMVAIHMTQCNNEDMEILKHYKVNVVHCPQSNMKLASGFCPVQKMLDKGINVALGTDSATSNNDLSLFDEMRTAALLSKQMTGNPESLPAYQVLQMATINGARALGLSSEIGSLERSKQADMIAVDLNDLNTQPMYDPISHLVYAVNARQVSDVWVAGRQLVKEHELFKTDEAAIIAKAKYWQQKLSQYAKR